MDGWRAAYDGVVPAAFLAGFVPDEQRVAEREQQLHHPGPHDVVLVAEQAGVVAGAAALCPAVDDDLDRADTAELRTLYVAPRAWGSGAGARLLEAGSARLPHPQQVLWTLEGNARARGSYARRGFVADGGRRVLDLGGPVPEVRFRRPRPT